MSKCESNSHVGVGIAIILIGAALLLNNLNIIPYWVDQYIFAWQNILILIGVVMLFNKSNKAPGIIMIVLGLVFWSPRWYHEAHRLIVPLGIILIGILVLSRRRHSAKRRYYAQGDKRNFDAGDPDSIDIVAVFSGGERIVTSKNFKGGKSTTIFGGAEINFLNAQLARGMDVSIDVVAIFGGITVIVPADWDVVVDVQNIFGGFSDQRHILPDQQPDESKRLFIKGTVLFGGGEIKSYK